jgi:hypothetical protein
MHRQCGQPRADAWTQLIDLKRGSAQPLQYCIGTVDVIVWHGLWIGAATPIRVIVARKLCLNVASECRISPDRGVDVRERGNVDIEPVVIAVKDQPRSSRFARGHLLDCGQREAIAIQTTDDVHDFGPKLRRTGKR